VVDCGRICDRCPGLFESFLFLEIASQLQLPVVSAQNNRSGLVERYEANTLREEQDNFRLQDKAYDLVMRGIPLPMIWIAKWNNLFTLHIFEHCELRPTSV
jgi:hypothetical protein